MKANKLSYKGFTGSAELSFEDDCLFGQIQFIDDVITYEGQTPAELAYSFKEAVDRYLAYCKSTGKPANKPYCGTFNVRVGADLHRACAVQAEQQALNLNEFVKKALIAATCKPDISHVEVNHHVSITLDRESMQAFQSSPAQQQWGSTSYVQ